MNIPVPSLMRVYGTDEVFFKKASGGDRTLDEVSQKIVGSLFQKIAATNARRGQLTKSAEAMAASMAKLARGVAPMPLAVKPMAVKPPPLPAAARGAPKPAGPPPMPNRANPSVLSVKPSGQLPRPNVTDFTQGQGVQSTAPAAPAARQVPSPLSTPRSGGIATGGHAPNINDFTTPPKQPGVLGRMMGQKPVPVAPDAAQAAGKPPPPTIKPLENSSPTGDVEKKPGMLGRAWQAVKPGWKTKALLGGAALGAGYLGYKALEAGKDFLESQGPQGYGYAPGGYQVPMGVNAYGQPQLGTPLM